MTHSVPAPHSITGCEIKKTFSYFQGLIAEFRTWQAFSVKGQRVNILGFVGHMVSFAKATVDNMSINGVAARAPILFMKTGSGQAYYDVLSSGVS